MFAYTYVYVVNEDYRVEDDMCCFEAGERTTQCRIVLITDGTAEEDETLHFKIVPTADNCVCDDNLVITIIKDVQRKLESIFIIASKIMGSFFHCSNYGTVWSHTLHS